MFKQSGQAASATNYMINKEIVGGRYTVVQYEGSDTRPNTVMVGKSVYNKGGLNISYNCAQFPVLIMKLIQQKEYSMDQIVDECNYIFSASGLDTIELADESDNPMVCAARFFYYVSVLTGSPTSETFVTTFDPYDHPMASKLQPVKGRNKIHTLKTYGSLQIGENGDTVKYWPYQAAQAPFEFSNVKGKIDLIYDCFGLAVTTLINLYELYTENIGVLQQYDSTNVEHREAINFMDPRDLKKLRKTFVPMPNNRTIHQRIEVKEIIYQKMKAQFKLAQSDQLAYRMKSLKAQIISLKLTPGIGSKLMDAMEKDAKTKKSQKVVPVTSKKSKPEDEDEQIQEQPADVDGDYFDIGEEELLELENVMNTPPRKSILKKRIRNDDGFDKELQDALQASLDDMAAMDNQDGPEDEEEQVKEQPEPEDVGEQVEEQPANVDAEKSDQEDINENEEKLRQFRSLMTTNQKVTAMNILATIPQDYLTGTEATLRKNLDSQIFENSREKMRYQKERNKQQLYSRQNQIGQSDITKLSQDTERDAKNLRNKSTVMLREGTGYTQIPAWTMQERSQVTQFVKTQLTPHLKRDKMAPTDRKALTVMLDELIRRMDITELSDNASREAKSDADEAIDLIWERNQQKIASTSRAVQKRGRKMDLAEEKRLVALKASEKAARLGKVTRNFPVVTKKHQTPKEAEDVDDRTITDKSSGSMSDSQTSVAVEKVIDKKAVSPTKAQMAEAPSTFLTRTIEERRANMTDQDKKEEIIMMYKEGNNRERDFDEDAFLMKYMAAKKEARKRSRSRDKEDKPSKNTGLRRMPGDQSEASDDLDEKRGTNRRNVKR